MNDSPATNAAALQKEARHPSVTAFYGFKGGTGRSFLLATCAVALAAMNRRVLVIDWDLEAPGVGDMFDASGNNVCVEWRRRPGVIDLLRDKSFPPYTPIGDKLSAMEASLRELLFGRPSDERQGDARYLIDIIEPRDGQGRLSLIGPGQHSTATHYFSSVLDVDWAWYFENRGADFLHLLRRVLVNEHQDQFDDILIDARTGYSAFVIPALRALADHVCVVGTYSFQSLDGIARVWPLLCDQSRNPPVSRHLILSRRQSGADTDAGQEADLLGKQELLKAYHIPLKNRLELPVVGNLHGGDGHLWGRARLFDGASAKPDAPARTAADKETISADSGPPAVAAQCGTPAIVEYLDTLAELLSRVFGVKSVAPPPALQTTEQSDLPMQWIHQWWIGRGDSKGKGESKRLSRKHGQETIPWKDQAEWVKKNRKLALASLLRSADKPPSVVDVDPQGAFGQSGNTEAVEPVFLASEQTHRSLPARALLAAEVHQMIETTDRPANVSELDWADRLRVARNSYGVDVSPISTEPRLPSENAHAEAPAAPPRPETPPRPVLSFTQQVQAWDKDVGDVIWARSPWFASETLDDIRATIERCAAGKANELLPKGGTAGGDTILAVVTIWIRAKDAARALGREQEMPALNLSEAIEKILASIWPGLRGPREEDGPLTDVLRLYRGLLVCVRAVHEQQPGEQEQDRWIQQCLESSAKVVVPRARRSTFRARSITWAGVMLRGQIRLLLKESSQRAAAVSEIEKAAAEFVEFVSTVSNKKVDQKDLSDIVQLAEWLAEVGRDTSLQYLGIQAFLAVMRMNPTLTSRVLPMLDLLLDELGSPGAFRASKDIAERSRPDPNAATPDAESRKQNAFILEWREFSLRHRVAENSNGLARYSYASYRAALQGLEAWFERTREEPGAQMVWEREAASTFRWGYRTELGELLPLPVASKVTKAWLCHCLARLQAARGDISAARASQRDAFQSAPRNLVDGDPRAWLFGQIRMLSILVGLLPDESTLLKPAAREQADAAWAEAEGVMQLVRLTILRKNYPSDQPMEAHFRESARRSVGSLVRGAGATVRRALERPWSCDLLGYSSGEEWPSHTRTGMAQFLIDFAQIAILCGRERLAAPVVAEALQILGVDACGSVPAGGFTGPLSIRMALSAALALALQSRLGESEPAPAQGDALSAALRWAQWDCAPERHGAGRKIYYDRVFRWAAEPTTRKAEIERWLTVSEPELA